MSQLSLRSFEAPVAVFRSLSCRNFVRFFITRYFTCLRSGVQIGKEATRLQAFLQIAKLCLHSSLLQLGIAPSVSARFAHTSRSQGRLPIPEAWWSSDQPFLPCGRFCAVLALRLHLVSACWCCSLSGHPKLCEACLPGLSSLVPRASLRLWSCAPKSL